MVQDYGSITVNRMGMFISLFFPYNNITTVLNVTPQINNDPAINLTNKTGWTLINGCFNAQGGETTVTIGNFFDDVNTNWLVDPTQPWPNWGNAYYLIDDVSVVPIEVNAGNDITINCTGTTQLGGNNCLESLNTGQFTYSWSLVSGNTVFGSLSSQSVQFPTFTANNTSPTAQTMVYQVQISTPGGCTAIDQVSITINSCCSLSMALNSQAPCSSSTSGSINGQLNNGTGPYVINWQQTVGGTASGSFTTPSTGFSIPQLSTGTYSVLVTDAGGCTALSIISIVLPLIPDAPLISGSTIACNLSEVYTISNFNAGFSYAWSSIIPPGGSPSTYPCFSNAVTLSPSGSVNSVTATFPNTNCNYLLQVVVTDPTSGCSTLTTYPINWCCSFNGISVDPDIHPLLNTNISSTNAVNISSYINSQGQLVTPQIHIAGTLTVDVSTFWLGSEIIMYPGSEIIVMPNCSLTMRQDEINPCEAFWKSITVLGGGHLVLRTCTIRGGQYAVDVHDNGSYLITDDNVFWDNYTAVRVSGSSGNFGRLIDRSTIELSSISPGNFYNLIYDYNGQTPRTLAPNDPCDEVPWAGIEIIGAGLINIGSPPIAQNNWTRLKIRDAMFGIRSIDSSPNVTNVEISAIQKRPCSSSAGNTGSGIYAKGRNLNFLVATDAGYTTTPPNDVFITNSYRGISTDNIGLLVERSRITEVDDAIRVSNPSSFIPTIITNNEICFHNQGIRMFSQNGPYYTLIADNLTLNECNGSVPGGQFKYGILLTSAMAGNGTSAQIGGNQINLINRAIGVSMSSFSGSYLIGNSVSLNNSTNDQVGLFLRGNSDLHCRENTVIGTPAPYPAGRVGLRAINNTVQNNNSVEYICNYLQNTDVGVEFISHNSSVIIDRTKIENANRGMFNNNSGLGIQVDRFNQWCGSFGAAAYNSTLFSQLTLETPLTGPGSGCEYNPFNFSVTGNGLFSIMSSTNNSYPGCANYFRSDTISLTDYDQFVIDSLYNYDLGEGTLWHLRRNLMQKLQRHQQLLSTNTTALNFWNEYVADEIGLLSSYKSRFDSLSFYTNDQLAAVVDMKETISDIEDQVQWIDSILQTRPESEDSVLYLLERDSLNELYNDLVSESDSLWQIGWAQALEVVNEYGAELATLNLNSDLAEKERLYHTFALKLGPWNVNHNFTSSDTSLLVELAHLCEVEYGHPVTWARGVYLNWFDEEVDDSEACGGGLRKKMDKESLEPTSLVSIRPNPASDQIIVKWHSFDIESTHSLRIYTINGTFVKEVQITGSVSYHDINELENSIYLIEVVKDNNIVYRLKLAIVK